MAKKTPARAARPRKAFRASEKPAETLPAKPRRGIGVLMGQGQPDNNRPEWELDGNVRVIYPGGEGAGAPKFTGWDLWVDIFRQNPFVSSGIRLVTDVIMSGMPKVVPAKGVKTPNKQNVALLEEFMESFHPYYTPKEFLRSEVESAVLAGRCYIEVCYNELNQPAEMWDLPQGTIHPKVNERSQFDDPSAAFLQVIKNRKNNEQTIYKFPWRNMLWMRLGGMRVDGSVNPISPMELLLVPTRSTMEAQDYIHSFFTTGGKMGLVISNAEWGKPEAIEMLKYYQREYSQSKQAHKMLILYGGTSVAPPPKEHNSWAEFIKIEEFDGRKVAGVLGYDPRLTAYPGEATLGGKGDREQLLVELHERCNDRRDQLSDIFTKQIVRQGFGIYDCDIRWPVFKNLKDAESFKMFADGWVANVKAGLVNTRKLDDLQHMRQQMDDGLPMLTEADLADWPEPTLPGAPVPIQALEGDDTNENPKGAGGGGGGRSKEMRRAPKGIQEKRTPFKEIEAHQDSWVSSTAEAIIKPLLVSLEESRKRFVKAFESGNKVDALRKTSTLLPGGSDIKAGFIRNLKSYYADSLTLCQEEIDALKKSSGLTGRRIDQESTGSIADMLEWFGKRQLDKLYNDLVSDEEDIFHAGIVAGWNSNELTEQLMQKTDGYAEAVVNTIVRTAGTDFFSQARLKTGEDSGIVSFYRFSAITDDRTTEICETLDELEIGAHDPDLGRVSPPCHFNCRSLLVFGMDGEDWETDTDQLRRGLDLISSTFGGKVTSSRAIQLAMDGILPGLPAEVLSALMGRKHGRIPA